MKDLNINLPSKINEFYVDCRNEQKYRENTQKDNKDQFNNIYNAIKTLPHMLTKIETKSESKINNSGKFPIVEKWETLWFYGQNNILIKNYKYPRPTSCKELCNLPQLEPKEWKEE